MANAPLVAFQGASWEMWSYIGGSILAGSAVVKTVLIPAVRRTTRAWKTIDRIWDEFQPNHGTSLRDQIDALHAKVDRAVEVGQHAQSVAQLAEDASKVGKALVEEGKRRDEQIERKLKEFIEYQYRRNHDILNSLTVIQGSYEVQSALKDLRERTQKESDA